jgi:hypothetical protein
MEMCKFPQPGRRTILLAAVLAANPASAICGYVFFFVLAMLLWAVA